MSKLKKDLEKLQKSFSTFKSGKPGNQQPKGKHGNVGNRKINIPRPPGGPKRTTPKAGPNQARSTPNPPKSTPSGKKKEKGKGTGRGAAQK